MMDKLKDWLLNSEEENIESDFYQVSKYEVNNYDLLENIGEDIKSKSVVICIIDDQHLIRTLDFIEGICFVLDVKEIVLNNNIYIFIPSFFRYKSNS